MEKRLHQMRTSLTVLTVQVEMMIQEMEQQTVKEVGREMLFHLEKVNQGIDRIERESGNETESMGIRLV